MLSELSLKVIFKQFKSDKTMLCKHTRSLSLTTTYSNCNIKDSLLQKHNKNHPTLAHYFGVSTNVNRQLFKTSEFFQSRLSFQSKTPREI